MTLPHLLSRRSPALLLLFLLLSEFACLCPAKLTVHLNCHTHDDVGWLKTVDQYYVGLNKTIDNSVVQYILHTTIDELVANPQRKFMYVEQAFFQRYWQQQSTERKNVIRGLVANKQLEFVNGGWCMHDEATTHYVDMIDQTTLGHRFIVDEFGPEANPTIGWQIDPFGHSATQASLLSSQAGFQAFFTARIDHADFRQRYATNATEWIWRASPSQPHATVFGGIFQWADRQLYGPPSIFNYELYSNSPPIQDDPRLTDYNLNDVVNTFVQTANEQAAHNRGNNLLWNLGFDFKGPFVPLPTPQRWCRTPVVSPRCALLVVLNWFLLLSCQAAHEWYKNVDKLIAAVNADGRVEAQYSTPSIYLKAKAAENLTFPLKTDDLFPYSSAVHEYWTGFFTSRPALKRYVRTASAQFQVLRQLEVWLDEGVSETETLWQNLAVAQHHDGVSGTSKQHVAFDYAQRIAKGINMAEAALYPRFAALITAAGGTAPHLSSCPLANVSICHATQTAPSTVILYNPLAHPRVERVVLPVSTTALQVVDSAGAVVPSDIVPVLVTPALGTGAAPYHLSFFAEVEGVGFNTYHITKSTRERHRFIDEVQQAAAPTPYQCGQGAGFNLTLDSVTLTFNSSCVLQSYIVNGTSIPLTHGVGFYYGWQSSNPRETLDCRGTNSGAYLFRPQEQTKHFLSPVNATIINGGAVVAEVRLTYGSWYSEILRLVKGSPVVEVEFTVGPIPIDDQRGKEILVSYTTTSSEPIPIIYTDSNGREFQKRVKDYRPTWNLTTSNEPVAQNYYPLNAVAYMNVTAGGIFSLVTDRSQGIASLSVGEMEVMVHRRLLCDDNKGVGEPLNETSDITHDNPGVPYGQPLVITGIHHLQFSQSMAPVRVLQNRVYSPLHPLLAPLTTTVAEYTSSHLTSTTALTSLSPSVEMSHLHRWNGTIPGGWNPTNKTALVRFAHLYGVGEGEDLSKPVKFDLAGLFNPNLTQLVKAVQVSLTANQPATSIQPWQWTMDGGEKTEAVNMGKEKETLVTATPTITIGPMEVQVTHTTYIKRYRQLVMHSPDLPLTCDAFVCGCLCISAYTAVYRPG